MAMHNIMARVHKSRVQLKTGAETNEPISNNNRYYKVSVGHKPSAYKSHYKMTEYKRTKYVQNKNPTTDKPLVIIIIHTIKLEHNQSLKLDRIVTHFLFNYRSADGNDTQAMLTDQMYCKR
jgi:hypothetical protein